MRKKLLALLMCATMVLGTAVTASAATSQSDAEKVYGKNADNFINEYYPADELIKGTVSNKLNGKVKTVEYGYLETATTLGATHAATVIYKAGANRDGVNGVDVAKDSYYPATAVAAFLKGTEQTVPTLGTENVSTAANRIFREAALTGLVAGDKVAVEVKDDNGNSKQVVLVDNAGAFVDYTEGMVDGTEKFAKYPAADTTKLVRASKGILKSTNENAIGTMYAKLEKTGDLQAYDVISAIDGGVFSKDAVAVKITAYTQGVYATVPLGIEETNVYNGNVKPLYNFDLIQSGEYTFDSDLISRTGFKGAEAVNVFQPTYAATKFDETFGDLVKDFVKVATVKVGDTITFTNGSTLLSGVFVFDKGELAAEPEADKNDGVSDTTTPAADNTASPKTGDVAPIAALAVVMMGAFGAMVVASKKRA